MTDGYKQDGPLESLCLKISLSPLVIVAWFLTGMFAGWLAVRHIRRLEPGSTRGQGLKVSAGWGCGAIVAAIVMIFLVGIVSNTLGL